MAKSSKLAGLILAAGKGTRMKSDLPKCAHSVCGLPMAEHIGHAMREIGIAKPVVVVGFGAQTLSNALGADRYEYAEQADQLGTAHAAIMAAPLLKDHEGPIIVSPGDVPLLDAEALRQLVDRHSKSGADATIGTCMLADPSGYGRIVRDGEGKVTGIVEEKDASIAQRQVKEINSAVYCFDCQTLYKILPTLDNKNAQGEYYLTDVIARIAADGGKVETLVYDDFFVFQGVNDRWQLAEAATEMRKRILRRHALSGVTIVDPATTYISADATIGVDTVIHPMTTVEGRTRIGEGCHIGPLSVVVESTIGDECTVLMSHVNRAEMKDESRCGPYAHLRPRTTIGERSKVGNFVELKNASLERDVAVSHLTYLGDATVGAGTNIGAGTITCNYDGVNKSVTAIGSNVFVGSNSTLVAPLTLGSGSYVAAGSVVTHDVESDALAIGRARQVDKAGWAQERRSKQGK